MENYINCPNCGKTISNNPVINSAANREDRGNTSFNCDCGERITFWAVTEQLRNQKKPGPRFMRWLRGLVQS